MSNGPERETCDQCHALPPAHIVWLLVTPVRFRLCCRCYVRSGSAPADWHPLCVKTYAEITGLPAPRRHG